MKIKLTFLLTFVLMSLNVQTIAAPKVTATIAPIHSLVSALMIDVAEPALLLQPYDSPHTFQMSPSDLNKLKDADLVIFVSEELEIFLTKPLQQINKAKKLSLLDIPDINKLPLRSEHHHHHHPHDVHHHGHFDPHVWLNTENAKLMADEITNALIELDPHHREKYQQNLKDLTIRLAVLKENIALKLKNSHEKPYIVFHDAYQYFETQFNLLPGEVITFHPDVPLSAKRISVLRRIIKKKHIKCAFIEPEFNADIVKKMFPSLHVRTLDPLGAYIEQGPKHYENMMMNLAVEISTCFEG